MKMWKSERTAKGNIVYVRLSKSKETVGHYFERISDVFFFFFFFFFFLPLCWIVYVITEQFHSSPSDYLKLEPFCFLLIAGST